VALNQLAALVLSGRDLLRRRLMYEGRHQALVAQVEEDLVHWLVEVEDAVEAHLGSYDLLQMRNSINPDGDRDAATESTSFLAWLEKRLESWP